MELLRVKAIVYESGIILELFDSPHLPQDQYLAAKTAGCDKALYVVDDGSRLMWKLPSSQSVRSGA